MRSLFSLKLALQLADLILKPVLNSLLLLTLHHPTNVVSRVHGRSQSHKLNLLPLVSRLKFSNLTPERLNLSQGRSVELIGLL